jgi:hypothetical protein
MAGKHKATGPQSGGRLLIMEILKIAVFFSLVLYNDNI